MWCVCWHRAGGGEHLLAHRFMLSPGSPGFHYCARDESYTSFDAVCGEVDLYQSLMALISVQVGWLWMGQGISFIPRPMSSFLLLVLQFLSTKSMFFIKNNKAHQCAWPSGHVICASPALDVASLSCYFTVVFLLSVRAVLNKHYKINEKKKGRKKKVWDWNTERRHFWVIFCSLLVWLWLPMCGIKLKTSVTIVFHVTTHKLRLLTMYGLKSLSGLSPFS